MSGFEVVSVVFGILPLLIEVVKGYSSVSANLSTFRHYSREVKKVQRQFKVHHEIFLNECRLLLRLVEDERGAKDMLDDELDGRWTDKELNGQLSGALKDNFQLCKSIIEACKEILDEIGDELMKFDVLKDKQMKNESIKTAIRRLKDAVRITFDKAKYEKSISLLRDHNADLSTLRSQMGVLSPPKPCPEKACISRKIVPPTIAAIRTASKGLHEALSAGWCCADQNHGGHYAKISVDGEVQSWVRLDLAISSCHEPLLQRDQRYLSEPPIWLHVQSVGMESRTYASATPPPQTSRQSKKRSLPIGNSEHGECVTISHESYCQSTTTTIKRIKKTKNVQSTNSKDHKPVQSVETASGDASVTIAKTAAQSSTPEINLRQTKNICHYLKQHSRIRDISTLKHCVGYLDSPQTYRHNFFFQKKYLASTSNPSHYEEAAILSIIDLMDQGVDDTLTVVEQLKLAHKTALATLQYNNTPWLQLRWRLKDVGYFGSRNVFNEEALQTLHLSSQISANKSAPGMTMEGVEDSIAPFSEEDYFGINNTTLFFLGVALLEIGHWKPLESMKTKGDPNEIVTARRLASKPTSLGSRYQEIARKCLQCNFGFGTDLEKKELQAAVYTDVVCQLEDMVKILSI